MTEPTTDGIELRPDSSVALTLLGEQFVLRAAARKEWRELQAEYAALRETVLELGQASLGRARDAAAASGKNVDAVERRFATQRQLASNLFDPERDDKIVGLILDWWRTAFNRLEVEGGAVPDDTDELPQWFCGDMTLIDRTLGHWAKVPTRPAA